MKDMIEVGGVMRPATSEKAQKLAKAQEKPILAARQKIVEAENELLRVCIEQYPVGSRVRVNIAARQDPIHEVKAVNENGWMTLENIHTGTKRGMMASSHLISPCVSWYEKMEKKA